MTYGTDDKVRATAASHIESRMRDRSSQIAPIEEAYIEKEKELLETIQEWKATRSPLIANQVGSLQLELQKLEQDRANAKYPVRYIKEMNLNKSAIDPQTGDTRLIPFSVYLGQEMVLNISDRTIPF
jgi:hypothetical protein